MGRREAVFFEVFCEIGAREGLGDRVTNQSESDFIAVRCFHGGYGLLEGIPAYEASKMSFGLVRPTCFAPATAPIALLKYLFYYLNFFITGGETIQHEDDRQTEEESEDYSNEEGISTGIIGWKDTFFQ